MQLLIDAQFLPGNVIDFCEGLAKQLKINTQIVRSRDKDLYLLSSSDFEKEVEQNRGSTVLQPLIEEMNPSDILITNDLKLASQALSKVTTVINGDGQVYTPQSLNLMTIQEYLAKSQGKPSFHATPLIKRDPELNEQFKQTLFSYLTMIK